MASGYHLTPIGRGNFLLEPSRNLDISNQDAVLVEVINRLQQARSQRLYYDLAELPVIEQYYYGWLERLAQACLAVNIRMICIHMQPTAAFGLAHIITEAPVFETALDVAER
jgi:rsbT antagonist protein RsbS